METNNSQKTIYQAYEEIKAREINELVTALRQHGGKFHFGPDSGADQPYIMINYDEPQDVSVNHVYLNDSTPVVVVKGYNDYEPWEVPLEDIAYGHIDFITSSVLSSTV